MDRLRMLGVAALLLTLACEEKKRNAPLADQTASITVVSAADGGQATNAVMIGDTDAFPLPVGDQPAVGRQPEMRAPGVYVVRLVDGFSRPAYLGTVSLFFGPRLAPDVPQPPITFLSGAVTGWSDPALRTKIVQVARERARGEVPELLVAVSDQATSEWRDAFLALPLDERAAVARELLPALGGERPERLLAAALASDLPSHADACVERLGELGTRGDHVTTAILLSALPTGPVRGAIACRLLTETTALPHGDPLLAAALLALGDGCVEPVRALVLRDGCEGDARCQGDAGTEMCTRDAAREVFARESRRSKWDVAATPDAPTSVLALSVLHEAKAVPPAFVATCRRATVR